MGDSGKHAHPTTSGMNILTPPCLWKLQMLYPHALSIPKLLTLLPSRISAFFPVSLAKTSHIRNPALFPFSKTILLTICGHAKTKSSLSKYKAVHCSFPFYCKCYLEFAYHQIKLVLFGSLASYFKKRRSFLYP